MDKSVALFIATVEGRLGMVTFLSAHHLIDINERGEEYVEISTMNGRQEIVDVLVHAMKIRQNDVNKLKLVECADNRIESGQCP